MRGGEIPWVVRKVGAFMKNNGAQRGENIAEDLQAVMKLFKTGTESSSFVELNSTNFYLNSFCESGL